MLDATRLLCTNFAIKYTCHHMKFHFSDTHLLYPQRMPDFEQQCFTYWMDQHNDCHLQVHQALWRPCTEHMLLSMSTAMCTVRTEAGTEQHCSIMLNAQKESYQFQTRKTLT